VKSEFEDGPLNGDVLAGVPEVGAEVNGNVAGDIVGLFVVVGGEVDGYGYYYPYHIGVNGC